MIVKDELVSDVRNKCLLYLSELLSDPKSLDKYDLVNIVALLKEVRKLK